jgi:hypothetical protein
MVFNFINKTAGKKIFMQNNTDKIFMQYTVNKVIKEELFKKRK